MLDLQQPSHLQGHCFALMNTFMVNFMNFVHVLELQIFMKKKNLGSNKDVIKFNFKKLNQQKKT